MAQQDSPWLSPSMQALAAALRLRVPVDAKGYCERPEDNLVQTVSPGLWQIIRADLDAGKGSELDNKFRAAHSSSALAANVFAPLSGWVTLPVGEWRGPVRLEQERSAWATGFRPTLDVIVDVGANPLFVESKCVEFLRSDHGNPTAFSDQFVKHSQKRLSAEAHLTFGYLAEDPYAFEPVDARQLAKHFLAAKRAVVDSPAVSSVLLLCCFWEPQDVEMLPSDDDDSEHVFARHRKQLQELALALPDAEVKLEVISYRDVWDHFSASDDLVLRRHGALLRQRYDVPVLPFA